MLPFPTPFSYVAREGCLHNRLSIAPRCLRRFARVRESQSSLPRNAPSRDEGGIDGCIRRLPFLASLAVFRAPSLQNKCCFVAFHRRAKARAKRARNAEHAGRGKVRCQLFLSAPSPVLSVPRSSFAWRFPFCSPEKRGKITPAGYRASRRV